MKRFISLAIYSLVVIGGSFIFKDNPDFPVFLYACSAIVGFGIVGMLIPGFGGGAYGSWSMGAKWGTAADLNYVKAQEGEQHQTKLDLVTMLTILYIIVPFLISIYLFC